MEDLVISKLCSSREKDYLDIQNEKVIKAIDWKVLNLLAEKVCTTMFSTMAIEDFNSRYDQYIRRFRDEKTDL